MPWQSVHSGEHAEGDRRPPQDSGGHARFMQAAAAAAFKRPRERSRKTKPRSWYHESSVEDSQLVEEMPAELEGRVLQQRAHRQQVSTHAQDAAREDKQRARLARRTTRGEQQPKHHDGRADADGPDWHACSKSDRTARNAPKKSAARSAPLTRSRPKAVVEPVWDESLDACIDGDAAAIADPIASAELDGDTLPLTFELLSYYRDLRSERDFDDAMTLVDACRVSEEEQARTRWEIEARTREVAELQGELGALRAELARERKRRFDAVAENDELKLRELQDRRKICELLDLPDADADDPHDTEIRLHDNKRRRVRRHVASRSIASAQEMQLRLSALKAQLKGQQDIFDVSLSELERERRARAEEEKLRQKGDATRIQEQQKEIARLREFYRENTRELLRMRGDARRIERESCEREAQLQNSIACLTRKLALERDHSAKAEQALQKRKYRQNDALVEKLQRELKQCQEALRQHKDSTDVPADIVKKRSDRLEKELKAHLATVRSQRQLELEGMGSDMTQLCRQLKSLERLILRYGPLEDHEMLIYSTAVDIKSKADLISKEVKQALARQP
ncbi:hypothetical protein THASP1DRAFT_27008 [Thamnocephalis sphaerospora]|uniref:Uncharacterized protein n=1 Tax=Thamnocephalis sphaerospora TaxID=78915 RepID=A0A4P9XXK0_9FUNG|nr:hypothetical protein THASP1DRAFT_27008 [Thamnocephalis sphaerospora]|eukprot:RKP11173.1 hypothetical protein THASP1DRAFT_27008 [Thamnocephalis sphaerospora]